MRDFAASLKLALALSSTPRLLLHNKFVVLDDLQTIAYYYYKHKVLVVVVVVAFAGVVVVVVVAAA